jgi:hypothetical protein
MNTRKLCHSLIQELRGARQVIEAMEGQIECMEATARRRRLAAEHEAQAAEERERHQRRERQDALDDLHHAQRCGDERAERKALSRLEAWA